MTSPIQTEPILSEVLAQAAHDADALFKALREACYRASSVEMLIVEPLLIEVNNIRTRLARLIEAREG